MAFKFEIGDKGKTYHYEGESESILGMKVGDKIQGQLIGGQFIGYEFEITGASDKAGFPIKKDVEGSMHKRVALSYGVGMRTTKPKNVKHKKTVHGNTISEDIIQINLKVVKEGAKKMAEIFPKTEKAPEAAA